MVRMCMSGFSKIMSLLAMINDKRDFSKYRLNQSTIEARPSNWSKCVASIRSGSVVRVYTKLGREPDLERDRNRAFDYMKRKYDIKEVIKEAVQGKEDVIMARFKCEPKLSAEEAEKISTEIIQSFARKRDMKELLEGAKFFAGATALAGAPGERRARRKFSFSP
jgi:hypothetical protein